MALIPKFTGALSCIGSALIARHIAKKWRTSNREPLVMSSLIMFNLSIADFIGSFFGGFLSTWMIPYDLSHDYAFAAGNQATCNTQAFLYWMMLFISNVSNMFLAVVYWLTVCREWPETKLRKIGWKLLFLGVPWIVGFVIQILPFSNHKDAFGDNFSCGNDSINVILFFLIGAFPVILLCMGALIRFVHRSDQRMDEFRTEGQSRNRENTIRVTYQAIWYSLALFIVGFPGYAKFLGVHFGELSEGWNRKLTIAIAIILPSQGLLNALVYFRPRYTADRERCRRRKQQLAQGQLHQNHSHINNSIFASICRVLDISLSSFPSFASTSATLTGLLSRQTNTEQTGEKTQQVAVQPQADLPRLNIRELISHTPETGEVTVTKEEHTTVGANVPDIDGAIHDETNLVFARNFADILDDANTNPDVIGK